MLCQQLGDRHKVDETGVCKNNHDQKLYYIDKELLAHVKDYDYRDNDDRELWLLEVNPYKASYPIYSAHGISEKEKLRQAGGVWHA